MKIVSRTIVLAFALILSISVNAQEHHIAFLKQPKWKKVLKMAKKQNKPIFVDAYTTWCGPCKMMDRDVFTNKEVADFFNESFINVKMDMEKGEGNQLKLDWEIKAFPTLLYFNTDGEIQHRVVGAFGVDEFMNYSSMALDENKMAINLQKRYDAGEREGAFMYDYLVSLRLGYHKELEKKVAYDYLGSLSNDDLLKKENWNVVKYFMKDPTSKGFQFLVKNQDKLAKVISDDEVAAKFYNTIDKQIESWSFWYGDKPFETEKETNLIAFLQHSNYDKAPVLLGKLLANKYKRLEDKEQYLSTLDYIVKFNLAEGSSRIVQYANNVMDTYESDRAWAKALLWLKIAEAKETRVEHKVAVLEAKSKVLEKLGNKTEAELAALAAKKADKEAEKAGTKIHSIPAMKMTGMTPKNTK
ncbi:thioredoxin family protein [Snuella sedimenti]|uniref:Thioredoxin family protein n=1 Tax=Snuella sedimenti TaxID=2798802 RepID=A0A8J7J0I1_9FLAO|nr:thioredoxin family protein [Snuella sedimenti]MBJ6367282.1 thioredoxin family protein [Snuella sedimenti]